MPAASDQDLIKGLEAEIKSNINLQTDQNEAVTWFATVKKDGDFAKNEKYHLALRVFSLDTFYGEFNEVKLKFLFNFITETNVLNKSKYQQ